MNAKSSLSGILVALILLALGLGGCTSQVTEPDAALSPMALATTPAPLEESWSVDWWIPRHEEKLAARDKSIELVMLGDSITHGWEDPGKGVWEQHFADIHTLNLGFSGDRTENVLWRLNHGEVEGLSPDLVVLMIGTNNTGHRMDPPEVIAAGIREILGELRQRLPETHIVLLAIFPREEAATDPMRINNRETNRLLKSVAVESGVEFADFNAGFLSDAGELSRDIMPDLLHPNATGYEIWANQLMPYVEKYLH